MEKSKSFRRIILITIIVILWAIMNVIAFERNLSPTFFVVINSIVFVLIVVRTWIGFKK